MKKKLRPTKPTKRTPENVKKFFEKLSMSRNVAHACRSIGIARSTAYDWREEDENFKRMWDEALKIADDTIEHTAWGRAIEGWEEPVFYRGEICGYVRKYSDPCLLALMRGNIPDKYKDRSEIQQTNTTRAVVHVVHEAKDD